eukprot:443508-Rhodomonas_salina.1
MSGADTVSARVRTCRSCRGWRVVRSRGRGEAGAAGISSDSLTNKTRRRLSRLCGRKSICRPSLPWTRGRSRRPRSDSSPGRRASFFNACAVLTEDVYACAVLALGVCVCACAVLTFGNVCARSCAVLTLETCVLARVRQAAQVLCQAMALAHASPDEPYQDDALWYCTPLCARYPMPGTDLASPRSALCPRYNVSSTDLSYSSRTLCVRYQMSGTDRAQSTTRRR